MKIEITKDHDAGLKKGQVKDVIRGVAERLISDGYAKKLDKKAKADKSEKSSKANKSL